MTCAHERRQFGVVILRDGRRHIAEVCADCLANVRGAGKWVAAHEVPDEASTLPVVKDYRAAEKRGEQGLLF